MTRVFIILLVIAAIFVGGYTVLTRDSAPKQTEEEGTMREEKEKTAALRAVGEYEGEGEAVKSYEGAVFRHTVTANIADPAEGKFYEGWLVDKLPELKFFSTGKLEQQGDAYTLTFEDAQNYPEHNDVVITEEAEELGLDGVPEAHVLEGSFAETFTIVYSDSGYEPREVSVHKGDTVTFSNESSIDMWPATAIHPTHTVYPGSGIEKCQGPENPFLFDACSSVVPGAAWSFSFDELGTWGFHDHLQTRFTGRITVEE